jgi:hypothetical protein
VTTFQDTDEFNELLEGRTLRFVLTGSESKSGRSLSAAFLDVDSGASVLIGVDSGALFVRVAEVAGEGESQ